MAALYESVRTCQYPCILVRMPISVALYMVSALRASWACVDVVCVCVFLWVCVGVWSRQEAGLGPSVLWCSMALLQSPVAVELLWRVKRCTDLSV